MTGLPHKLAQIQQWMQTVIVHPLGVERGLASEDARRHLDVGPDALEKVIGRSRKLSSLERLTIYGDAYYARLLECLGEAFPMFKRAVGEEAFRDFSFGYVQSYPSESYSLEYLGAHLSDYLRETRPTREEVLREKDGSEKVADWPSLLIELVALEWAISRVFNGPGVEGQPLLAADDLVQIPARDWPGTRLKIVECLQLLAFHYPVNDYYSSLRGEVQPEPPEPRKTYLALSRRNYMVRRFFSGAAGVRAARCLASGTNSW